MTVIDLQLKKSQKTLNTIGYYSKNLCSLQKKSKCQNKTTFKDISSINLSFIKLFHSDQEISSKILINSNDLFSKNSHDLILFTLQIYYMHYYTKNSAREFLTETELYQDLTTALICFKQKLKRIVYQSNLQNNEPPSYINIQVHQNEQNIDSLILKYQKPQIIKPQFEIILERFLIRMKEQLRQLAICLPKYKNNLQTSFKKLEFHTFKLLQKKFYSAAMTSILQYIEKLSFSSIAAIQLKTKDKIENSLTVDMIFTKNKQLMELKNRSAENLKTKQSEAEKFIRNAEKYTCIDIDIQYLRGRYFDLKVDEKKLFNQAITRNNYIKNLITNFEKEYSTYKQKNVINRRHASANLKSNRRNYYISSSFQQNKQQIIQGILESGFKLYRENIINYSSLQNKNRNEKTTQSSLEGRTITQTFRTAYQEKLRQRHSNAVKMKNVIVILEGNQNLSCQKNINSKRLQFFKKSKEQTKLRYKYYNYTKKEAQSSKNSMKYKITNPENMFTTLTYM